MSAPITKKSINLLGNTCLKDAHHFKNSEESYPTKEFFKGSYIYCIRRIFFASLEKKKETSKHIKKINKTNEEIKTNIETKKFK